MSQNTTFKEIVEENMKVLNQRHNNLITQMITIKKRQVNATEYRQFKSEMDSRRQETEGERMERVAYEVLEEAREERMRAEEDRRQAEELNNQTLNK